MITPIDEMPIKTYIIISAIKLFLNCFESI